MSKFQEFKQENSNLSARDLYDLGDLRRRIKEDSSQENLDRIRSQIPDYRPELRQAFENLLKPETKKDDEGWLI